MQSLAGRLPHNDAVEIETSGRQRKSRGGGWGVLAGTRASGEENDYKEKKRGRKMAASMRAV